MAGQFGALFARTKKLDFFLPTPWTVLQTLAGLCVTGEFWATIALSLGRILAGMVVGTLLGIGRSHLRQLLGATGSSPL